MRFLVYLPTSFFLSLFCLVGLKAQAQTVTPSNASYLKILDDSPSLDSLQYKTLFKALKAADLDAVFENEEGYTIFAPSELAFSNLPSDKFNQLLMAEDKKLLNYILSSHILQGQWSAAKLLLAMCKGGGRAIFTTIQGNNLIASMKDLDIVLTDNLGNETTIIVADINRENTVIHEIDSVLVASRL